MRHRTIIYPGSARGLSRAECCTERLQPSTLTTVLNHQVKDISPDFDPVTILAQNGRN